MSKLDYFNRHVRLTLKFLKQNLDLEREVTYEHYIPLNNTKVYNNIRISFDIEKYPSKGLDCNGTAKIMIYNISDDINDLLANESLIKKVDLQVGYGDKTETIYRGTVNTSYVTYNNNDMITYLWCFTFASTLLKNDYNKPYPFATPTTYYKALRLILDDVGKTLQLDKNNEKISIIIKYLDADVANKIVSSTFKNKTVQGLKEMLNMISKDLSCDYYLEDNIVYLGSYREEKKNGLVELSPQNGLLNNPNVTDSGLEIKCILNPRIKMFTPVKVVADFADYSGDGYNFTDATKKINARYALGFKSFYSNSQAIFVAHTGDTHANLWETRLTTITLNESINPKAVKVI